MRLKKQEELHACAHLGELHGRGKNQENFQFWEMRTKIRFSQGCVYLLVRVLLVAKTIYGMKSTLCALKDGFPSSLFIYLSDFHWMPNYLEDQRGL